MPVESCMRVAPFYAAIETYAPDVVVPVHRHERAYASFILAGGYRELCGTADHTCAESTFTYHPAGERHSNRMATRATTEVYVTVLQDGWLARLPSHRIDWRNPKVALTARRLANEIAHPDDLSAEVVSCLLQDLLLQFTRERRQETGVPKWLRRVADKLRAHPHGTVASLAEEAGVSPSHLSRCFQRQYGCTVGEFARHVRLDLAVARYAQGPVPIGELASLAGFADQSHFTRAFRAQYGTTPREFFSQMAD